MRGPVFPQTGTAISRCSLSEQSTRIIYIEMEQGLEKRIEVGQRRSESD